MNADDSEKILEMPFLRNIGIVITYKCQVACPHCIIKAGPNRKEVVSIKDAFNWIDQIANYRNGYIKSLSLTGGEPFYNLDNLKKISTFAEKCGLLVSAVTNAFWASTYERAVKTLKNLPAIKVISISSDVYHQESIPFGRVRNAILAAKECDIPYTISVCTENEDEVEYKKIINKLLEITEKDTILQGITLPVGRAYQKLGTLNYLLTTEPPIAACSAGSSPIIFPNGRVISCIGPVIDLPPTHPLFLGNIRQNSLEEIFNKAEVNPILHAIRIWGPKKLITLLKENSLDNFLPKKYIKDSVCNACYSLMSSSKFVEFLNQLLEDFDFRRKVAYARVYYLNETKMVEMLRISETQLMQ